MIELLANHLWQSTIVGALAALLTLALRHNRAQARYMLWLAASVKFLVPFSALVALAGLFDRRSAGSAQSDVTFIVDSASQPFSQPAIAAAAAASFASHRVAAALPFVIAAIWFVGCAAILLTWLTRWLRVATVVRTASPVDRGRELAMLRRLAPVVGVAKPIGLVSSDTALEPGVFGVTEPVLLWPRTVVDRLDDKQVEAILSHELAHVRRRDNLTAALHMLVEALFWFHPMVWWIGARLVDERERACDEDVVRLGSEPEIYAQGILRICESYVESPLACVAGVTGSGLKRRIEDIMKNQTAATLNVWRRLLLVTAGVVVIVGPVAVGVLDAPRLRAQSQAADAGNLAFTVASIKQNTSHDQRRYPWDMANGHLALKNMPLRNVIVNAYQLPIGPSLVGFPSDLDADRYDIEAKAAGNPTNEQMRLMLRKLLADRFGLIAHTETRESPAYALVLARSDGTLGPQLRPSACAGKNTADSAPPRPLEPGEAPPLSCGGAQSRPGRLAARWLTMTELADHGLGPILGRKVIDQTGLTGKFDVTAAWEPAPGPPGPQAFGVGPSTFKALEEQLGLRLNAQTAPVDVFVIDRLERPVEH